MKRIRIFLGLSLFLFIFSTISCVSTFEHQKVLDELKAVKGELKDFSDAAEQLKNKNIILESENEEIKKELNKKSNQVNELKEKLAKSTELKEEFAAKLDDMIKGSKGGIKRVGNVLVVANDILYEKGSAEIKEEGKNALGKVANILKDYPEYMIRVDGHTDIDPIRKTKYLYQSGDNFELSGKRALYVTLYLKSQGIKGERLYYCSFSKYRPVDKGTTEDAKKKNRRVEIRLIPKSMLEVPVKIIDKTKKKIKPKLPNKKK